MGSRMALTSLSLFLLPVMKFTTWVADVGFSVAIMICVIFSQELNTLVCRIEASEINNHSDVVKGAASTAFRLCIYVCKWPSPIESIRWGRGLTVEHIFGLIAYHHLSPGHRVSEVNILRFVNRINYCSR